jgi:phospholipid/cholesterol/gamma-HCH transport system substrate-binding protein
VNTRGRHALLGVLAIALFVGSVWLTWTFLQGGFQGGTPVRAIFSAPGVGQQLPEGGDVKIRGVLVGYIRDVVIEDGKAVIEMRINEGEQIPESSTAEIRSKTVFGQKWIELIPTDDVDGPFLAAGSEIPDERTIEPLELERALELGSDLLSQIPLDDLSEVFRTLAEGFSGQEEDAALAIDRGVVALRAVNSRSAEFDLALRQLAEFSAWLDDNDGSLLSFMNSLDSANRALVGAAPELRSNLQSVPVFFNELARFQEGIEGDLSVLVEDGATLTELVADRDEDLRDLIVNLEAFTTVWNSGLSQPCGGLYERNMTCWQVYQPPGLDNRGMYRNGQAPDSNEPGDPNFRGASSSSSALDVLIDALASGAEVSDLARIVLGPVTGPGGTP